MKDLENKIKKIDGKGYGGYKTLKGQYQYRDYILDVVYVQGDPFASPSLIKIKADLMRLGYEDITDSRKNISVPFTDYITRILKKSIKNEIKGRRGSGKSGKIEIYNPGQAILKRSCVEIVGKNLEISLYLGLPAAGRKVLGKEALIMFNDEIPKIVKDIKKDRINFKKLQEHINQFLDAEYLRNYLNDNNYICFIKNGSILPRMSGVNDKPMKDPVLFESPKNLEINIKMADGKEISGMGIKQGVTIITGGGFHGKSTILKAIETGVYNHIPNDGREFVITDDTAFKIRAEDGRTINNVDISPFINNLPYGKDTTNFNTDDASGSTSQAANIIEAVEAGSKLLLIDEDTSATNFMVRDLKIQEVIKREKEPINPFIERVNSMYKEMGISTIIVVGGIGDYFDVADTILMLDEYRVKDITKKAKSICKKYNDYENKEIIKSGFDIKNRDIDYNKLRNIIGRKQKVKSRDIDKILINKSELDIKYLEQIIEKGQTNFISEIIKYISKENNKISLNSLLEKIEKDIRESNISKAINKDSGSLVETRKLEIIGALNRIRENIFY